MRRVGIIVWALLGVPIAGIASYYATVNGLVGVAYGCAGLLLIVLAAAVFTRRRCAAAARDGFTLVELMVALAIIAILAALTFGALNSARNSARTANTRATITKLHEIVCGRLQDYRSRRTEYERAYDSDGKLDVVSTAWNRLYAIRELQRVEMPDRWSDVIVFHESSPPTRKYDDASPCVSASVRNNSLLHRYADRAEAAWNRLSGDRNAKIRTNASAELLYMIVMSTPEGAEEIGGGKTGDTDKDGLPEFLDAWGRPIRFIRWPVGFNDSELQTLDGEKDHDILDQRRLDKPGESYRGCKLIPLIYSAGSDGVYDVNIADMYQYDHEPDPYADIPDSELLIGQPFDQHGDGENWWDNVHNHRR